MCVCVRTLFIVAQKKNSISFHMTFEKRKALILMHVKMSIRAKEVNNQIFTSCQLGRNLNTVVLLI